jgi:hypothetical protein
MNRVNKSRQAAAQQQIKFVSERMEHRPWADTVAFAEMNTKDVAPQHEALDWVDTIPLQLDRIRSGRLRNR